MFDEMTDDELDKRIDDLYFQIEVFEESLDDAIDVSKTNEETLKMFYVDFYVSIEERNRREESKNENS